MKKLGIVITDGFGFRNFILSDFLVEAEKTFDGLLVFFDWLFINLNVIIPC